MRAVLALVLLATPVLADPTLTAEEFDALTQGRTMSWAEFGSVYGVEQYLPGRKVRWTVLGDDCKTGHWYPDGTAICFLYEDDLDPYCWEITASGNGLRARFTTAINDELDRSVGLSGSALSRSGRAAVSVVGLSVVM